MFIVIATNTNGINRAFIITASVRAARKLEDELMAGGWANVKINKVDSIMHNTLKFTTN